MSKKGIKYNPIAARMVYGTTAVSYQNLMNFYTSTSNSNNFSSAGLPPFSEGNLVVLISGRGTDPTPPANPIWGQGGSLIRGLVEKVSSDRIYVRWEDGYINTYFIGDGSCKLDLFSNVEGDTKKAKKKDVKLDTSKLDPLVISDKDKIEIISVLKQHNNSIKLFEEWGLNETIEYGKGMTIMFYGPPGTGKTWGANCIAKAIGTTLLTISAAEIQSSEPGGANRAIQNAFKSAKEEGKVLFLDECDSLITSRAHVGMILSSEINTLLTEIEKCEGVVVLATNRIEEMDEALERRISLIVNFPHPTFEQREAIWGKILPKKMPLAKDVDIKKLSEYSLTGGQIKNVVLQAARLACAEDAIDVNLTHFDSAIKRVMSSRSLMGKSGRYNQHKTDYVKTS